MADKKITLTIGGRLPYGQRLQVLDLLCWRMVQSAKRMRSREYTEQTEFLEPIVSALSELYDNATHQLEALRWAPSFDVPDRIRFGGRFRKDYSPDHWAEYIAQPLIPQYDQTLADALSNQGALQLAAGTLCLQSTGAQPYDVSWIHTENPLKVAAIFGGVLGLGALVLMAVENANIEPDATRVRDVCADISERYETELFAARIDPKRLGELHQAFSDCMRSDIFVANPIRVGLPKAPE
jgi:hypothetical protein